VSSINSPRIAHYLNLPVVAVSIAGGSRASDEMVKNPTNPAYTPNSLLGYHHEMKFLDRLVNSLMTLADLLVYQ
jgi:UDP-glucoronosyl and UDP-glucosyl transferase